MDLDRYHSRPPQGNMRLGRGGFEEERPSSQPAWTWSLTNRKLTRIDTGKADQVNDGIDETIMTKAKTTEIYEMRVVDLGVRF